VARQLIELGFREVFVLEGGWPAWHGAGLPVEPRGI
jgi:rhodanese-related sulfurtransferase